MLLTRSKHSIQETQLEQERFHHVCWYQIAGCLSEADLKDEISRYLVVQFLDFLKQKDMSMEKVTWEYIKGLPAMMNLLSMMATAIAEVNPEFNVRKTIGAAWAGYYINDDLFIGFRFSTHMSITLENDRGYNPTFKRELELEAIHFFSLSAGEQLESLIRFIETSIQEYSGDK